jgi:hypothetical protein
MHRVYLPQQLARVHVRQADGVARCELILHSEHTWLAVEGALSSGGAGDDPGREISHEVTKWKRAYREERALRRRWRGQARDLRARFDSLTRPAAAEAVADSDEAPLVAGCGGERWAGTACLVIGASLVLLVAGIAAATAGGWL